MTQNMSQKRDYDRASRAADVVRDKIRDHGLDPDLLRTGSAVVLGSGLQRKDKFPSRLGEHPLTIPFRDIPTLKENTGKPAPGHSLELMIGPLEGDEKHLVAAFLGRKHLYEDHTADACVFYVRMLKLLGVDVLGITNAAGILNHREIKRGDVVMIRDCMNRTGTSALHGPTEAMWGEPFTSMKDMLPEWIIAKAREIATKTLRWKRLPSGVYLQDRGSLRRYQTAAESQEMKILGADLVGKSTVIELEAAQDAGIPHKFAATLATNYAFGMLPASQPEVTSGHVVEEGEKNADKFSAFLSLLLQAIHQKLKK